MADAVLSATERESSELAGSDGWHRAASRDSSSAVRPR
jgi:hypothetical protein